MTLADHGIVFESPLVFDVRVAERADRTGGRLLRLDEQLVELRRQGAPCPAHVRISPISGYRPPVNAQATILRHT
jgi:hypothetical protein